MRFKVVLVPFPFDDLTGQKVRPAVCLTNPVGIHKHVVFAFVSSTIPSPMESSDILLDPAMPDFALTGLRFPSVLRLHRMVTTTRTIIRRQLGVISPNIQAQIRQNLRQLFSL
jgi:mRNA interferase MazF